MNLANRAHADQLRRNCSSSSRRIAVSSGRQHSAECSEDSSRLRAPAASPRRRSSACWRRRSCCAPSRSSRRKPGSTGATTRSRRRRRRWRRSRLGSRTSRPRSTTSRRCTAARAGWRRSSRTPTPTATRSSSRTGCRTARASVARQVSYFHERVIARCVETTVRLCAPRRSSTCAADLPLPGCGVHRRDRRAGEAVPVEQRGHPVFVGCPRPVTWAFEKLRPFLSKAQYDSIAFAEVDELGELASTLPAELGGDAEWTVDACIAERAHGGRRRRASVQRYRGLPAQLCDARPRGQGRQSGCRRAGGDGGGGGRDGGRGGRRGRAEEADEAGASAGVERRRDARAPRLRPRPR